MTPEPGRILEWDSTFWGLRVAKASSSSLDDVAAAELDAWCAGARVDCAFLLAAADDAETAEVARAHRYFHADTRITLEALLQVDVRREVEGVRAREAAPADLARLEVIAAVSHDQTRFYFDRRFPREGCSDMYRQWIRKSCQGWADAVFVMEFEGTVSGYVTCHVDDSVRAHIGLLGVDAGARGKGTGKTLVTTARNWAEARGMQVMSVATQARNVGGLRLYESCDFKASSADAWYHCWYDPGPL